MNGREDTVRNDARALQRQHYFNGIVVALVVVLIAGLTRWLLNPLLGFRVPFATFFLAIVVAVRFGGVWSAVLTTVLGLGWAGLFWFPEGLLASESLTGGAVYLFSAAAIIALGHRMHRAEAIAEVRSRQLEDTVHGLQLSQGRLQLATEVSGIGVFEWDVLHDRFTGENPEVYRILGRDPAQPKLSINEFIERHLHPDDAQRLQLLLAQSMRPGEHFHAVFRSRRGDSDWRWVEVSGRFLFDEAGAPTHLLGVIADISERKQLEDNLRQMAADLSEADHRKDEFLATLAHELRNPLAPIRNGIELLKRGQGNPVQTSRVVGVMERQMSHMVRLVDDLIDVSRITRNKLELRRERVQLAQVIESAVEASRPMLEAKGHRLSVSIPTAPIHLDADLTRLVQVFANLLNNSVKYTDRGGHVQLSAERIGREVVITVADNGSGIPVAMLAKVFEMFTQLERSLERSQGGLGIGLSMVKRLVELHGGSVTIHSDGAGLGTRAQVRLPVVLSPEPRPVAVEPGAIAAPPRRRILVVDDNQDAAESLAGILALIGNDTAIANDGVEAVAEAINFRPHVVMLDLGMPRMNGYEACRQIRNQPGNRDTVIIAVTGWGQDEDRRRSEEAGFNLHLTKPVDPVALEALLRSLPPPAIDPRLA